MTATPRRTRLATLIASARPNQLVVDLAEADRAARLAESNRLARLADALVIDGSNEAAAILFSRAIDLAAV